MLDAEMRSRLEAALRAHDLKGIVDQLRRDGLPQPAIYAVCEAFYLEVSKAGREADADEISDALDLIWGFCSRSAMWFDAPLTDELVRPYREVDSTIDDM